MAEYIDRDKILFELFEAYDSIDPRFLRGRAIREAIALIKKEINTMPAADVAPVKRGKWIMKNFHKGVCNQCHRLDDIDPLATHCRYCGAKMDGDINATD